MITNIFTFGVGQMFKNGYVVISAGSSERCRELMFECYGTKWSMQYDEKDFDSSYNDVKVASVAELPNGKIIVETYENRFEHL